MTPMTVTVVINDRAHTAEVEPRLLLVDFIRHVAGLTGTHVGCDTTSCGACTVHVDGRSIKSCTMLAAQAEGRSVRTIESVAGEAGLHPVQAAFHEHHALQCGFCTPGMVMRTLELLADNPAPSRQEIRQGLSGNVCRCTGFQNIVTAIEAVSREVSDATAGRP
ncbi:MAG TPA: (2Fe-2S)-binding protein [Acidimicrobiales bacterium]|jgi:carbon-monoxide dehydrogenase small subunit|nr:(2Fe-2S)-binding protein [Acidimicrobiales bacterium]